MSLLVCFDICSLKASPLEMYENLKSRTIRDEIVPLPDPGGPIIKARKILAISKLNLGTISLKRAGKKYFCFFSLTFEISNNRTDEKLINHMMPG